MIRESHFCSTWVFLRDGKVIDLSGMHVDDAAQFVSEIERLTNQGVVIVEDGEPIRPREVRVRRGRES